MNLKQKDLLAVAGYYLLQTALSLVVAMLFEGWFYISAMENAMTAQQVSDALYNFILRTGSIQLVIANVLTLLVVWIIARRKKTGFLKHSGLDLKMDSGLTGVICVIAGAAAGFWFSCVLNSGLIPADIIANYQQSSAVLDSGPLWASIAAVILTAPIVEEIIFRVLIYRHLGALLPVGAVIFVQGLLFGGAHGDYLWMAYATVLGCIIGLIRNRTGSLRATIIFHISFNAAGYLFGLMADSLFERPWGFETLLIGSGFVFLCGIIAIDRRRKKAC